MSLTRRLAEFAAGLRFDSLGPEVIAKCKQLVLDCLGNQIGASAETPPRLLFEVLEVESAKGPSTVVGFGTRTTPLLAACINGTLAHTLDMDDAHRDSLTKTGSAITPAAMAVAEAFESSGREVVAAVVAGYEIMIRLGLAVNPSHRKRGFHSTATLGAFGAAATAGRLLALSPDQMTSALGIAGTQSAGLTAFINNPSMIKPFNVGKGVQNGVLAALLAKKGFIGPDNILEGSEGFLKAYADRVDTSRLEKDLEIHFHILKSGFKPHAACRYAHGPIDAALSLMREHKFSAAEIRKVDVYLSELAYRQSHFYEPKNVTSAQGSTPFSIAAGIVQSAQSLTVQDIRAAFDNPLTWDLHRKIHMHVDKTMDYMGRGCRLAVDLDVGKRYEASVQLPRGEPENPMSDEEIRAKFCRQAEPLLGGRQARKVESLTSALERLESVAVIMQNTIAGQRQRVNVARAAEPAFVRCATARSVRAAVLPAEPERNKNSY